MKTLLNFRLVALCLLCLNVSIVGFSQEKFSTKKFDVEKNYDDKIKKRINKYRAVELKVSDLKKLVKNKHKALEGVSFSINIGDESVEFRLFENDIIDNDFTLFENGKATKPNKVDINTYAGYAYNNPEHYLRLYISDKYLMGYYHSPTGKYYIQPYEEFLDEKDKAKNFDRLVVYNLEDELPTEGEILCGNSFGKIPKNRRVGALPPPQGTSNDNGCKVLKVAVETDNQFCNIYNNDEGTMNANIYNWFNQVEEVYVRHFNLRVKIRSISYWTTSQDPYPDGSIYPNTDAFKYDYALGSTLNNFTIWWKNNRNNVDRDVAHLLTGKGLTYGPPNTASWGEALYFGSGAGSVCQFDGPTHQAFSMSTVRHNVSKSILGNDDIYRNICHEIAHTLGAVDVAGVGGTVNIMTASPSKSKNFDGSSVSLISAYLGSISCLSTATSAGYRSLFSLKLDGSSITNTPKFINNSTHTLDVAVTNNNSYLQTTVFSATHPSVYLYYTTNYSTKFEPNGVSSFSININPSNTCYYDYWSVPFVLQSGARIAYPNVASDNLTIENEENVADNEPLVMKLFSENGMMVEQYEGNKKTVLKTSHLPNGTYYLHIYHTDKTRETKKILINH